MKKAIFLCFALLFVLFSCGKPAPSLEKPRVLVSVPAHQYFVEKIGGDTLSVHPLVPSGANPHIFEPTPREVEKTQGAALWFTVGESFENKILQVLQERNSSLAVVSMSEGVDLIAGCCASHSYDRHIWLSPKQAKIQARTVAANLIKTYPANEALYNKNLEELLGELDALDFKLTALLEPLKGETLLVSHPAFGYFCKDYGLHQISVEHEGKDPLPQHVASILEEARRSPIHSILLQPQYNNKGAELIAKNLHLPTFTIDPYSSDYIKMMESLGEVIAK